MQADYDKLFAILEQEEEIKVLINPFISAYHNKATAQLEGQIASAKIGLARLSSPQLYYVLSGNDFTLDVNNPKEPKIVSIGNNPQKLQIYGAVLSLYISRMIKLVNRKDQQKCSLVFDEFPTIYFNNIDSLIATARSNKVRHHISGTGFQSVEKRLWVRTGGCDYRHSRQCNQRAGHRKYSKNPVREFWQDRTGQEQYDH